jgi:hypothetical protein
MEAVDHLRAGRVVVVMGDLLMSEIEKASQAAGVSTDGLLRQTPHLVH